MSYDDNEKSQYQGKPVECYLWTQGPDSWAQTSADREITLPLGTFIPETLSRSRPELSEEAQAETLEVTVPRTHPIAGFFIAELPSEPISFVLYRAHRGDEANYASFFSGMVLNCRFEGSQAVLLHGSLKSLLQKGFPPLRFQTPCNQVLYQCGANPTTSVDTVSVTTVSGSTVVSNDFAARADQWFRGGRLVAPSGETRYIVDHVGDTVKLIGPLPGLQSLDVCQAFWGCDHLETTCESKFNNLVNHMGFARIPGKDPHQTRIG